MLLRPRCGESFVHLATTMADFKTTAVWTPPYVFFVTVVHSA